MTTEQATTIHEYETFDKVAELAALIEEHGPAFAVYAGHVGLDFATGAGFADAFCGEWDSESDFAENYAEEMGYSQEDWEGWADELFTDSHFSADAKPSGVYVFLRL